MDAVHFISDCLAQVHLRLVATCNDLTQDQLLWRPAPTANNIGFILWHLARHEDTRITETGSLGEDVWATGSWHEPREAGTTNLTSRSPPQTPAIAWAYDNWLYRL